MVGYRLWTLPSSPNFSCRQHNPSFFLHQRGIIEADLSAVALAKADARKNYPKKQCSLASASEISFLSESNGIANQKSTANFLPGLNEQEICFATDKVREGIAGRRVRRRGETADNLVFSKARRNRFEHRRKPAGITCRTAGRIKAFQARMRSESISPSQRELLQSLR